MASSSVCQMNGFEIQTGNIIFVPLWEGEEIL